MQRLRRRRAPRATVVAARRHPAEVGRCPPKPSVPPSFPHATGAEVPAEVVDALGEGRRRKVAITINGHTWRSRIVTKGGRYLVGISAANRAAASIVEGDHMSSPSSS